MSSTVISNIATLVTTDPSLGDASPLGPVHDAAVVIEGRLAEPVVLAESGPSLLDRQ